MAVVGVSHGYPPLWNMGGEVSLHRTLASLKKEEVVVAEPVEMSIQIADCQGQQNVNSF
jgi:hypothetical protein